MTKLLVVTLNAPMHDIPAMRTQRPELFSRVTPCFVHFGVTVAKTRIPNDVFAAVVREEFGGPLLEFVFA